MLMTEYDYDTDIAVQREEAYEDGLSKGFQQGISQGISQGIKQGAYEKAVETARLLLSFGDSIEKITTITGLSGETLQQLSEDLQLR
ncbi:MAG: hypothetical protein IJA53_05205 [Spirochaetaceae bacterium]|nr:hypothetical protein [Spirochaetaceae bacterium]